MRITYHFNPVALHSAATEAGDTMRSGRLNYELISRRSGIDRAVVSRVHRGVNVPDLTTILSIAKAYGLAVEDLLSISAGQVAAAA